MHGAVSVLLVASLDGPTRSAQDSQTATSKVLRRLSTDRIRPGRHFVEVAPPQRRALDPGEHQGALGPGNIDREVLVQYGDYPPPGCRPHGGQPLTRL